MATRKRINALDFALAWNAAESPAEVAAQFEITELRAKQKASQFRRKNIPCKVFARTFPGSANDWDEIRQKVENDLRERGIDPNTVHKPKSRDDGEGTNESGETRAPRARKASTKKKRASK